MWVLQKFICVLLHLRSGVHLLIAEIRFSDLADLCAFVSKLVQT